MEQDLKTKNLPTLTGRVETRTANCAVLDLVSMRTIQNQLNGSLGGVIQMVLPTCVRPEIGPRGRRVPSAAAAVQRKVRQE